MASLISVPAAWEKIIARVRPAPVVRVPLSAALGHVLAEDARADRDWPPFDRSMVDGYAVIAAETATPPSTFSVVGEVTAGATAANPLRPGQAIAINTGAPIPPGADAVIMVEQTETIAPDKVRLNAAVRPRQNISPRGEDARENAVVIAAGTPITAAEIGVLAFIGVHQVPVRQRPRVAILGTGNELVEPNETPAFAQIRNSNSHQLLAQCAAHNLEARYCGIARDDREQTRRQIQDALENADLFISTGGVSVGAHDHVGASFAELGVDLAFNKVAVKPGKPTTFGTRGETMVFGLPGNPVAAWVCFHLFVLTAVRARMGASEILPRHHPLPVSGSAKSSGDRPAFRPARLIQKDGATRVSIVPWHGSGHLASLVGADGLAAQPANEELRDGQQIEYYPFY